MIASILIAAVSLVLSGIAIVVAFLGAEEGTW